MLPTTALDKLLDWLEENTDVVLPERSGVQDKFQELLAAEEPE